MRNNTKKGFTLVELLVVIAILAILATVSVVGYTSFIERANVSNDQNIAAQLNQFLTALKADSRGEFYDDIKENGIHEDNVWEITQYILYDCGLEGKLEPQAGKYNHHFYFDFEAQEYVVLSDEKAIDPNSGFENLWELLIGAETSETKYNVRPGNFFTANNQYFLVDTTGALAEVVNSFYTFNGTGDDLKTLFDKASKIKNADGDTVDALLNMIKETVFVTTSGNLVYDLTTDHKYIFIDENVTVIPNIKTDKDGRPQVISSENPLIKTGEKVTIALPENVTLYGDSLNIDVLDGGDVVVSIDAKNWNDVIDLVDANFTNNDVTVELNGAKYKVNEYIVNTTRVNESGKLEATEDIATVLKYKYRLDSFNAGIVDNNDNKVHNVPVENPGKANNTTGYSAWEKGEFYLDITSALGTGEDKNIISTYDVEWSLGTITWQDANVVDYGIANDGKTEYIKVHPNGKVELADGLAPKINEFTVTATATVDRNGYVKGYHTEYNADNAAKQTVTVKVVRVQSASFTLAGNTLMDGKSAILINGADANNHSAVLTKINYVNELSDIVLSESLTLANVGTPVGFSVVDNKVQTSALAENVKEGSGSITITIGDHAQYTTSIVTYDVSKLPLQPKFTTNRAGHNANEIFNLYIGNSNAVSISDLFTGTIPEDAELIAFGVAPNDSYINYNGRVEIPTRAEADALIKEATDKGLTAPTIEVTADHVINGDVINYQSLDFAGIRDGIITIAVYRNGVRISDDITFYLVNGTNVRDYDELQKIISTTDKDANGILRHNIKDNVVLLNEVKMSGSINYFELPAEMTFYGNCLKLDITNGRIKEEGIINLYGRIQDTKVIGQVYTQFGMRATSDYGSSAICAKGGASEIDNCYVANCRSPLRLNDNAIVKNSIFFGGKYSNIDITRGILTIQGDVITVNQKYTYNKTQMLGMGIAFWWSADPTVSKVVIDTDNKGNLIQNNFISTSDTGAMPTIGIVELAAEVGLDLSSIKLMIDMLPASIKPEIPIGTIFGRVIATNTFSASVYGENTINTGIVYLNKTTDGINKYNVDSTSMALYDYVFNPDVEQSRLVARITKWVLGKIIGTETMPIVVNTYLNDSTPSTEDEPTKNETMYNNSSNAVNDYWFETYNFVNGNIVH